MANPDRQQQTKVAPTLHGSSVTYRIKPRRNARTHSKGQVTRRGELVRDSFLGSGTLTASERCGRRFRGLNIDGAYVDVAIDRWIAMTGGTPELAHRRKA
jgi:DNA modification methylase